MTDAAGSRQRFVLLLGLFMALGFSGYLLPWNQLSFFATRVGTAIVGAYSVWSREPVSTTSV